MKPGKKELSLYCLSEDLTANLRYAEGMKQVLEEKQILPEQCSITLLTGDERAGSVLQADRNGYGFGSVLAMEKEELMAYTVLGLEPYRYLALPRFVAFITMIPCLTAISNALALIGGWIVCVLALDITTYTYYTGMQYLFNSMDLWAGIIKSFVFGTLIFVLAYYNGINAKPGARGVGLATMNVVVSSCLMILIADFALDAVMFF